jgi:hypothetical protein
MSERYARYLRRALPVQNLAGHIGTNDCNVLSSRNPKGRKKSRIGRRASEMSDAIGVKAMGGAAWRAAGEKPPPLPIVAVDLEPGFLVWPSFGIRRPVRSNSTH